AAEAGGAGRRAGGAGGGGGERRGRRGGGVVVREEDRREEWREGRVQAEVVPLDDRAGRRSADHEWQPVERLPAAGPRSGHGRCQGFPPFGSRDLRTASVRRARPSPRSSHTSQGARAPDGGI